MFTGWKSFCEARGDSFIETPSLIYVTGYKYQSRNDMVFKTAVYPEQDIITDLIVLRKDGWLWVGKYFAWDGASGPTWDDETNMRASLVHDALYALMRMGLLDPKRWRKLADAELCRIMLKDGAGKFRANYYEWAVNNFAEEFALPENSRQEFCAPRKLSHY